MTEHPGPTSFGATGAVTLATAAAWPAVHLVGALARALDRALELDALLDAEGSPS